MRLIYSRLLISTVLFAAVLALAALRADGGPIGGEDAAPLLHATR